jgi:hypothetical protein
MAAKTEQDYKETANKVIVRPKTLTCYICGRDFGSKSLEIHIKSCKKKWENEQMLKPPNERRPCPEEPKMLAEIKLTGGGNKA